MDINLAEDFTTVSELKRRANELLDHVQSTKRATFITRNGKPAAAIVDIEVYQLLSELIEAHDLLLLADTVEEELEQGSAVEWDSMRDGLISRWGNRAGAA
ncbi:MAG: type II toxin-antitoxin system Phd/YefM family antitoxin [Phormidesmis sp.]